MAREPQLSEALRWLRLRSQLTQHQVCERVRQSGGEISGIYLSMLERGQRNPSPAKLDLLLAALGSDRAELRRLYEAEPWAASPPPRGPSAPRIRRRQPHAAAQRETWSSPVSAPPTPADEQLADLVSIWPRLSPGEREELLRRARQHATAGQSPAEKENL